MQRIESALCRKVSWIALPDSGAKLQIAVRGSIHHRERKGAGKFLCRSQSKMDSRLRGNDGRFGLRGSLGGWDSGAEPQGFVLMSLRVKQELDSGLRLRRPRNDGVGER